MKKIGEYTTRGVLDSETTKRLSLFDGRFDTGYKVVEFMIVSQDLAAGDDCYGTLFTDKDGSGSNKWLFNDNSQIAWAATNASTGASYAPFSLVDPDNLVVEDLFIRAKETGGSKVNYFIRMHKYDITDWQGALAMVRSKSQNVGSA